MSLIYSLHIPSTHLGAFATFSNIQVFTAAAQPSKGARLAENLAAKALGDGKWVPFESYETDSKSPAGAPDRGGQGVRWILVKRIQREPSRRARWDEDPYNLAEPPAHLFPNGKKMGIGGLCTSTGWWSGRNRPELSQSLPGGPT